jgi:hypothetical protein
MNWIILLNFVATLFSFGIIYRAFTEVNSTDLVFGIICLTINLGCLVFNLARKLFDK